MTITAVINELRCSVIKKDEFKSIRKAGGGRKKSIVKEVGSVEAVLEMVKPYTIGDPMNTLLWTGKDTGKLSQELIRNGYNVSYNIVNRILSSEGFSLQSNKKV